MYVLNKGFSLKHTYPIPIGMIYTSAIPFLLDQPLVWVTRIHLFDKDRALILASIMHMAKSVRGYGPLLPLGSEQHKVLLFGSI